MHDQDISTKVLKTQRGGRDQQQALDTSRIGAPTNTQTGVNKPAVSFIGSYGATLTVAADQAVAYALLKTEQIAALNRLMADHIGGCQIELTENEIWTFAELAAELAHQSKELIARAEDARAYAKGGA